MNNKIEVLNEAKRYSDLNGGGGGGTVSDDKTLANLLKTNMKFDRTLNLQKNITGTMIIDSLQDGLSITEYLGATYDSEDKVVKL